MVGNLGDYQRIVQLAKNVGGPKWLIALLVGSGAVAGATAPAVYKKAVAACRSRSFESVDTSTGSFTVEKAVHLQKSQPLREGETFSVIAQDGDVVVLEIDGRRDNPHVVSLEELSAASDIPVDFML